MTKEIKVGDFVTLKENGGRPNISYNKKYKVLGIDYFCGEKYYEIIDDTYKRRIIYAERFELYKRKIYKVLI